MRCSYAVKALEGTSMGNRCTFGVLLGNVQAKELPDEEARRLRRPRSTQERGGSSWMQWDKRLMCEQSRCLTDGLVAGDIACLKAM
jgi:hypothetical protein